MAGGKAETALVLGIQHHITLNENTLGILSVGDAAQRGRSGREGPAGPHGTFPRILPPGPDFHVAPSGDRLRIPLDSLIRSMACFGLLAVSSTPTMPRHPTDTRKRWCFSGNFSQIVSN